MADVNDQQPEEKFPVLADRKKWEEGAQLLVPLAQLTMEESLSASEGKEARFESALSVACYVSYWIFTKHALIY